MDDLLFDEYLSTIFLPYVTEVQSRPELEDQSSVVLTDSVLPHVSDRVRMILPASGTEPGIFSARSRSWRRQSQARSTTDLMMQRSESWFKRMNKLRRLRRSEDHSEKRCSKRTLPPNPSTSKLQRTNSDRTLDSKSYRHGASKSLNCRGGDRHSDSGSLIRNSYQYKPSEKSIPFKISLLPIEKWDDVGKWQIREVFISIVLLFQICDKSSVSRATFDSRPEFDSHLDLLAPECSWVGRTCADTDRIFRR
jgi:hypothetical protein